MNKNLTRGVAPIFGKDKCTFLYNGAYITLGVEKSFGSQLYKGFSICIDIQADKNRTHTILGAGEEGKTSVFIQLNYVDEKIILSVKIQDENGKRLYANCYLSSYIAKRLIICIDIKNNEIVFNEINLIENGELLHTNYVYKENPSYFCDFSSEIYLGARYINNEIEANISSKLAKFSIFDKLLDRNDVQQLILLSRQEIDLNNCASVYQVEASKERRTLFLDDLSKLEVFSQQQRLSRTDTRDTSVILFRWLFDKHPLLQELCNELGIQLTLASEGERSRNFKKVVADYKPVVMLPMNMGKRTLLDYDWMPLKYFSKDTACIVNGHTVSVESFIKFVRHKLGGGHFDITNRTKWQRDIVEMTNHIENDSNFMNHHIREIILSVLDSVYENRISVNSTA